MTELDIRTNDNAVQQAQAPAAPQAPSTLAVWAEEARVISSIAVSIAKTSFAGQLRGKPEEVTAVILAGNELGFKPMAALKAFDIIQGTPAMRAHGMRGLVQSHGHKIQLVESDAQRCVMRGRRADDDEWQTVEWDMPRAALLGLVGKNEWKKQPKTMLVARATGELCRLIASDVLHGVPYTSEELRDDTVQTTVSVTARPRLSVAAITAAPQTDQPTTAVENVEPSQPDDTWEPDAAEDTDGALWPEVNQPPAS